MSEASKVAGNLSPLKYTNATGGNLTVGDIIAVGDLVALLSDAGMGSSGPNTVLANGSTGLVIVQGVVEGPKVAGSGGACVAGQQAFWNAGGDVFTPVAADGIYAGVFYQNVAEAASRCHVALNQVSNYGGGSDFGAAGIAADVIAESTGAAGVTIDGVLLKDNDVKADSLEAKTGATGLNVFESGGKGGFFGTAPATRPAHVADPAAMAAITTTPVVLTNMEDGSANNTLEAITDTSMSDQSGAIERNFDKIGDEINALGVDIAAAKTAIDANNAAIDSINAMCATLGLTAAA